MRIFVVVSFAASLLTTPVFAGDMPLPSGKPAGITKAQDEDHTVLYLIGGGAVIAGIVILATNNNGSTLSTGTTRASTTTT